MSNKLKNKKENGNKNKKSKEPNPVVIDGDSNMSKPVRGLN
ncbi:hypothetical protein RSJ21_11230 [Clostridium botulinum]|uniref:Uncharacterized protein n=1 Tax=Clostridium sporogenes TaxID=1509 RepID=A0A1L3NGR2_CLOSG|nr:MULTISPECIES: hypothetical protein [Clostridium]EPS49551.1 hypothetical protein CFSAN002368_17080 [Clostridium botulinum A1 str. CFSAN002368]ACA56991.1 conserved hypothetical protein [Clostridium botulinum A3 str. Loch Maree]APH15302.1 hypothetical protein NPD5_4197 [Clostridium sporogenes]AUN21932.1 hypothetical protein RSJ22_11000 [Clostridium botulinum]AUN25785.1 hypothetical protein RSJ21_11230 [Clostridium botulinum]